MKKSDLVVKDNALIQSGYSLSLVEARLILLAIVEARETGQGLTAESYLEIHASHYADKFQVTIKTAYEALSDAAQTLFQRQVTLYTIDAASQKPEKQVIRWVSGIAYVDDMAKVKVRFSPDVVPLITRLERNFTSYELERVSALRSAYAVRLYELLIQWRSVGKTPMFELQKFREQMGVEDHEYVLLYNLKTRVLDLAIEQINQHTDIQVSYAQYKQGRTVIGFSFEFKVRKPEQAAIRADKLLTLSEHQLNALLNDQTFMGQHAAAGESWTQAQARLRKKLMTQPEQFKEFLPL